MAIIKYLLMLLLGYYSLAMPKIGKIMYFTPEVME